MLTIEWIRHRGPDEPPAVVETTPCSGNGLRDVVATAKSQFAETRKRLPLNPPDGFRIVDGSGKELAQWFVAVDLASANGLAEAAMSHAFRRLRPSMSWLSRLLRLGRA